jgi:hypothetical protein
MRETSSLGLRAPHYVVFFPKSGRTWLRKQRLDDPLTLPITESPLLWIANSAGCTVRRGPLRGRIHRTGHATVGIGISRGD